MLTEKEKIDFDKKIKWADEAIKKAKDIVHLGGDSSDANFWLNVASVRIKSWEPNANLANSQN